MKKFTIFALLLSCIVMTQAADLTGVKIYLNPGHGGWNGANDRNISTIPYGYGDTLGFWESSSNLKVAEYLEEMLLKANATVYMSRRTNQSGTRDNGSSDWDGKVIGVDKDSIKDPMVGDRDLKMIAQEASDLNVDAFLSIHSNAAGSDGAPGKACNYLVFFMPGNDKVTGSNWDFENYRDSADIRMAYAMWPYMLDNPLDVWTEAKDPASPNIPTTGEYTLLKYGNLTVPGYICEASFHSYRPNTHRYLNPDYQYLEALRFYYFYCDYFKADFPTTSCLCGDVRAGQYRMKNMLYKDYVSGSKDQWTPLNGTEVTLMKNGETVATYVCDYNYNGIYCFKEVEPGDYQIKFHYETYTDTIINITAVAGKTITTNVLLKDPNYVPGGMREELPDYPFWNEEETIEAEDTLQIEDQHSEMVTLTDLEGLKIRRTLMRDGKIYALTDDSKIYVFGDGYIKELFTDGISEGTRLISDIAFTADGILMACNCNTIGYYDTSVYFKLYQWEDDNSHPELVFKISGAGVNGCWTNGIVGETMCISGSSWNFKLYTQATTTGSTQYTRVIGLEWDADDELFALQKYMFDETSEETKAHYSIGAWGTDFKFYPSPLSENSFIIDGSKIQPMEYQFDWSAADRTKLNELDTCYAIDAAATGISFFKYAGKTFMAADSINGEMTLYDITEGMKNAVAVKALVSQFDAASKATYCATGAYTNDGKVFVDNLVNGRGYRHYLMSVAKFIPSGLDNISNNAIVYSNGILYNTNHAEMIVYNAAGQIVAMTNESVDMTAMPDGVYVANTADNTLKFVK